MPITIEKVWTLKCPSCGKRLTRHDDGQWVWFSRDVAAASLRYLASRGGLDRMTQCHTQDGQIAELCSESCLKKYKKRVR